MKRILLAGMAFWLVTTAVVAQDKMAEPSLHDQYVTAVLWQQVSGEYRALCYQAFNWARMVFDQQLAGPKKTKPLAVIVDIDETVMDNSPYSARQIVDRLNYPAGWEDWTLSATARAVPGAVEFLQYIASKNAEVFYVSNRNMREKSATIENLKSLGLPDADTLHVMVKTTQSGKEPRRQKVAESHEIVLLVGDNLNDFSDVFEKKSVEDRFKAVDKTKELFGQKFIVLPNPMYGDWEGALYNYNYKLTEKEKSDCRKQGLRTK